MKIFARMGKYLIIEGIFYLFMGVCLVLAPMTTLNTIVMITAVVLGVYGVINIISFFKSRDGGSYLNRFLILGIIQLIGALILFVYKGNVAILLPIALGVIIVVSSSVNVLYSLDIRKQQGSSWVGVLIYGLLCILMGIVIIVNPFMGVEIVIMICGIMMFVRAAGNFTLFFTGKKLKRELDR